MRNIKIKNLDAPVPLKIRLKVYEEAIKFIQENPTKSVERENKGTGLCLLLPCLLWGLKRYSYDTPSGEIWWYRDVIIAFPEVKQWVKESGKTGILYSKKDPDRIKVLQEAIRTVKTLIENEEYNV